MVFDLQGYIVRENLTGQTASQILSALTDLTVPVVSEEKYTWAGIAKAIGPEAAEALRVKLTESGLGWAVHQLGGAGLSLGDEQVQAVLTAFVTANVAGAATLKALGRYSRSLWSTLTPDSAPNLSQVEAALAGAQLTVARNSALATGRAEMQSQWATFESSVQAWDGSGPAPEF